MSDRAPLGLRHENRRAPSGSYCAVTARPCLPQNSASAIALLFLGTASLVRGDPRSASKRAFASIHSRGIICAGRPLSRADNPRQKRSLVSSVAADVGACADTRTKWRVPSCAVQTRTCGSATMMEKDSRFHTVASSSILSAVNHS